MSTQSEPGSNNRYQMVRTVAKKAKVIVHSDHGMPRNNHSAIREAMAHKSEQESQTQR